MKQWPVPQRFVLVAIAAPAAVAPADVLAVPKKKRPGEDLLLPVFKNKSLNYSHVTLYA